MNLQLTTYKSYKELCNAMDWKVTGGDSKKSQLKDLERFCKYHKEGNKFIIDEVFETPLPKEDNKRNSVYVEYVEKLIIHMMSKFQKDEEQKIMDIARNGLFYSLYMVNKNYKVARNNINRFSRLIEVPTTCVYDFFNNTSSKLSRNVERALNRLRGQCLIEWEYRTKVMLRTGHRRLATDEEIKEILKAERVALFKLNKKDKREVFLSNKWNEFSSIVSKQLQENTDIDYYFKVFHIVTTEDFNKMLLEADDLEEIMNEINDNVYLSTIKTAKKHYENMQIKWNRTTLKGKSIGIPKYENEQVALRPEYIEDTKKIANKVIELDAEELCLDGISNEKYSLYEALCGFSEDDFDELFDFF